MLIAPLKWDTGHKLMMQQPNTNFNRKTSANGDWRLANRKTAANGE
jgi:hypothetical protein